MYGVFCSDMYFIYFLYSPSFDKYYIGYSEDPQRRLIQHNTSPRMTYTHKHRPWVLKACFPVSDSRQMAIKMERYLKKLKSRKIIEEIIRNNSLPKLPGSVG